MNIIDSMSVVFRDLNALPDSFSKMVDWIRHDSKEMKSDVFHQEGDGDDGNGTVWVAPTFKGFLDADGVTVIENTATTTNDGMSLGLYGTGLWDGNSNGYTIGTADSISFTPSDEWAYEIQETDVDGKVQTIVVLPLEKYENSTEGTTVSLLRAQTLPLESADGATDLGVMTLSIANGTSATGDNVAKRGCTDEKASNYEETNLVDDASCEFAEWYESIPTWGWAFGGIAVVGMVMGLRR